MAKVTLGRQVAAALVCAAGCGSFRGATGDACPRCGGEATGARRSPEDKSFGPAPESK